ncbi:hypothetical protein K438DRAFT_800574 [Mycena galopus ATCC 62051]|nr:hypothetical protein K438DRAFT_800574 [Mycena galopus ATCC 62051]
MRRDQSNTLAAGAFAELLVYLQQHFRCCLDINSIFDNLVNKARRAGFQAFKTPHEILYIVLKSSNNGWNNASPARFISPMPSMCWNPRIPPNWQKTGIHFTFGTVRYEVGTLQSLRQQYVFPLILATNDIGQHRLRLDFNLWTKLWGCFLSFFSTNMYLISYSLGFNVSPPLPPTFRSTLTTVELDTMTLYQHLQYPSTTFFGSGRPAGM